MAIILIIDDQPANLKLLVDLLRQKNHTLLVASSGIQGLEILKVQLPDLILLDVMMPGMDGFQVCKEVKKNPESNDIPVIFLTALGDIKDKSRAFDVGGIDFIPKPFHEQEVLLRIHTHLTLYKQRKELEQQKETLSVTLRSIGDAVITTDTSGKIVFLNKIAEHLTGWSNDEAYGKDSTEVFTIINEKTGEQCLNPAQKVLEIGRIVNLANHTTLITKDGSTISIADSGSPIRDSKSNIIGVVIVFRDVTHENMLEAELLKSKKLESIGILAGGIAHDFNNILAAIMGNIDLASHFLLAEPGRAAELLEAAKNASKRAAKLTNQLLTFSRGGNPIKESSSLPKIVSESADFVLQGSKVSCIYDFTDDIWPVDVDAGQIGQVIQNIIINGVQAMQEGGTIQVECSNITDPVKETLLTIHDTEYVRIRITDHGIGIPQQIIEKIFDPYFSTKQLGSGLGLAICYSIIHKHDGYITTSSTPGVGTTFTIYLPAQPDTTVKGEKTVPTDATVKASHIMIMDDEKMILDVVRAQLTSLGHEAILVKDGQKAIDQYQELQNAGCPIDLAILDLTIAGGMGGEETAEKLLEIDPQAKLVVCSGYSNDPVIGDYKSFGFQASLIKPFDLEELNKVLSSVLVDS
jgi:PAS domain S-box-containing protein